MNRIIHILCALLLSASAMAYEECEVKLLNDFRVSSQFLQVSSDAMQHYEIREEGYLSVHGKEVALTGQQRALAEEYAGEVAALASQWIELVSTTLGVVGVALETALEQVFGENSPAAAKAGAAVAQAKQKFEDLAKSEDGVYSLTAQDYNNLGDTLSEEIETAVQASMGSLFHELGHAMLDGEGSFEERMAAFGRRMEVMGAEFEHLGQSLAETGEVLCTQVKAIQKLERKVAKKIPEVADYPLFGS